MKMAPLNQIDGFDATGSRHSRRKTYGVKVGHVQVGGGAPIVVQSMTNTDTADVESTVKQSSNSPTPAPKSFASP